MICSDNSIIQHKINMEKRQCYTVVFCYFDQALAQTC